MSASEKRPRLKRTHLRGPRQKLATRRPNSQSRTHICRRFVAQLDLLISLNGTQSRRWSARALHRCSGTFRTIHGGHQFLMNYQRLNDKHLRLKWSKKRALAAKIRSTKIFYFSEWWIYATAQLVLNICIARLKIDRFLYRKSFIFLKFLFGFGEIVIFDNYCAALLRIRRLQRTMASWSALSNLPVSSTLFAHFCTPFAHFCTLFATGSCPFGLCSIILELTSGATIAARSKSTLSAEPHSVRSSAGHVPQQIANNISLVCNIRQ